MKSAAFVLAALIGTASLAQSAPPADAFAPDVPRLRASIAGNSFDWHPADSGVGDANVTARVEYTEGGVAISNASNGAFNKGPWRIEGGRLCVRWEKLPRLATTSASQETRCGCAMRAGSGLI